MRAAPWRCRASKRPNRKPIRTVGTLNAPPKSPNIFANNAPSLSLSISLIVAAFSPGYKSEAHLVLSMKITIIDGMSGGRTNIVRNSEAKAGLDRMDVALLGLLQNNARLSVKEIAAEVGLAPSSTHERIKRMRDSAVLRGTHAEVDPKALGVGLEALFMIELSKHHRGTVDQFMDDIAGVPEVRVAFLVTGRDDVVVHGGVRHTQPLNNLPHHHFTSRPVLTPLATPTTSDPR